MTICVPVGVATEPVGPLPLICTLGDPALAKKPDGYVSVMLLPAASAPPAVVMRQNVAAAPVFPATRSDGCILKGAGRIVRGVPETVATLLPFVNVSCTDDDDGAVSPITTVTVVALR